MIPLILNVCDSLLTCGAISDTEGATKGPQLISSLLPVLCVLLSAMCDNNNVNLVNLHI